MRNYLLIGFLALGLASAAQTSVDEAKAAADKAPRNQALNIAAGDALKDAGRYREAITYYIKGGNRGNLGAAEAAFLNYNFDSARSYLDKYLAKRTKAEQAKDMTYTAPGADEAEDWTDVLANRISLGASMLDRVENVQIIDSINVPAAECFRFIKLARSAGGFAPSDRVEQAVGQREMDRLGVEDIMNPAYITESGDEFVWVGSNPEGSSAVAESTRLADGSWDTPVKLFDYASLFGNTSGSWVDYPFQLSDGVTLYFAADGEESLGELDIFMTRRDEDGFLQPSNIGMPFNSPANDYLYAIDEETGTGFWVTDRNNISDSVTVYTFIPREVRVNYPTDTPDLASFARVNRIADTWEAGKDYSDILRRIARLDEGGRKSTGIEFDFAMPDGRTLHRLSDFHSNMARQAMQKYLDEAKALRETEGRLEALRHDYAKGDKSVGEEIRSLENALPQRRAELRNLSNQVVTLEL